MLGIAIGERIARVGRFGPEGRPTMTVTNLTGADTAADPAAALTALLAGAAGEEAVLGLPASTGREAEAGLRRAAEDAGLRVVRVVPEPVAVALHYGAIAEGVHRTVLVVDQAATTVDLTVLAITPDLTVRVVTTRTEELAGDHALAAMARVLTEAAPDAVLLSGDLYTTPARRADVENLPGARSLTVRCTAPELAVVHGLLLLEDFGLLRVATGPAAATRFPLPLEDPEPRTWPTPVADPEPGYSADGDGPEGSGAATDEVGSRGHEHPPPSRVGPPTATTRPLRATTPDHEAAPRPDHDLPPAPDHGPAPRPDHEPPPAPDHGPAPRTDHGPAPQRGRGPAPRPDRASDRRPAPEPGHDPAPPPAPPSAPALRSVPVTQLQAIRRDDHLLVLWAWPDSALTARVRWRREGTTAGGDGPRDGDIRCQRRVYEHDGGLDLPVGRCAVTLTVEALVPDAALDTEGAASLRIPAEPPIVEYEPSLRRRLTGARTATVTFTARTGCDLPALRIVHGLGRYRPTSTADGTVLHEVPAQRLTAGTPLTVTFPLPGTRGPSWLVCFPVDGPDPEQNPDIDIRPTALHRLRVT
ncbi:hypothetical protein GCM10010503_19980 [Streptomyces lucensis JCM 4490]|uniref:Uncharacterized protein n=1 Tax=Streptomyces lucensis JCM 4490 TaxID=1306176 RepID=A0A918J1Q8_9ACTN|nr:Hsp70 family protein [Streptomyces lucensis]GGW43371.1 hypothetical protein GCM10010503_19980 [Streptomyces lucensis JCM 4490]